MDKQFCAKSIASVLKIFFFIFLFLTDIILFAQDFTGIQKIPDRVEAGNDFIIETAIRRNRVTGFTIFFQPLPEGYSVEEIDSKGGTFTDAEHGAKIVWLTPPNALNYSVSYKISVPKNAKGLLTLGAKISYFGDDNVRKTFNFHTKTIAINNAANIVKKDASKAVASKKDIDNPKASLTSSAGKTFRVQIGAFNLKPKITGVPELTNVILDNGMTKYFSGNFDSIESTEIRKKEMIRKGFKDAFIVSFENGKIMAK